MGTGWRKAFCTSIRRDATTHATAAASAAAPPPSPSPRPCSKLAFFSSLSSSGTGGGSTPTTPRLQTPSGLRVRTSRTATPRATVAEDGGGGSTTNSPRLQCKTTAGAASLLPSPRTQVQTPVTGTVSNPCSPRSPSRFALLKNSLRFSRNRCGICLRSVKAVQGTAIFIAECSHSFHFPCISSHVRKQGALVCPVCATAWRQVPLLSLHNPVPDDVPLESDDTSAATQQGGWRAAIKGRREKLEMAAAVEEKSRGDSNSNSKTNPTAAALLAKAYNDDEPLLSPGGSGSGFNPIPEAEDEDEDDGKSSDYEFQGFFTPTPPSPSISTSQQQQHQIIANNSIELTISPESALLSTGRNHDKYVVSVKLKAPSPPHLRATATTPLLDPSRRAPIDLVTVLDVGGSMSGAKFQMLRRSMRQVIASLSPADRLSIVAFSSAAKRLLPLKRMTPQGQRAARRLIDRLVCSNQGGAAAGEALRKATRVLEERRERNPVASIILLSDGQQQKDATPSRHHAPPPATASLSCRSSSTTSSGGGTRFAHLEIPVNSPEVMASMEEPPEDAFARCVGGLLSVVVQDVKLQLCCRSGEITAIYSVGGQPATVGGGCVRVGDLYAEEERELLVELRVPSGHGGDVQTILTARCNYKDPSIQALVESEEQDMVVRLPPNHHRRGPSLLVRSPRSLSSSSAAMCPKAEKLRNLFVTTRAISEARRLVDLNDTATAVHLLSSARSLLQQSTSADENLRAVEGEMLEVQRRRQQQRRRRDGEREAMAAAALEDGGEALTPTSAWRAAERLAKLAIMRKSLNRVSDLHGFEDARF